MIDILEILVEKYVDPIIVEYFRYNLKNSKLTMLSIKYKYN